MNESARNVKFPCRLLHLAQAQLNIIKYIRFKSVSYSIITDKRHFHWCELCKKILFPKVSYSLYFFCSYSSRSSPPPSPPLVAIGCYSMPSPLVLLSTTSITFYHRRHHLPVQLAVAATILAIAIGATVCTTSITFHHHFPP